MPKRSNKRSVDISVSTCLLTDVAIYYTDRLREYGTTPRGVDWNGWEGQVLRFEQLEKIIAGGSPFSLNDLGCGYGALYEFLKSKHSNFSYLGCDISAAMIDAARARYGSREDLQYTVGCIPARCADYGIASGIFNVRFGYSDADWRKYIKTTLDVLARTSRLGFAFNCLTTYSDPEKARPDLFYANPCELFDYCQRKFSRHVAVLHDYGLYEFTILVRKFQ